MKKLLSFLLSALPLALVACSNNHLYEPCEYTRQCSEDNECFSLTFAREDGSTSQGAFCSHTCATDEDCDGGVCMALSGEPSGTYLCVERCPLAAGCYEGFTCSPLRGGDEEVSGCLPQ